MWKAIIGNSRSPYSSVSLVQGQALMTKDEYLVTVKTFVIIPNDRLGVINILFAIDQFPPVQTYTDGDFYENSGIR